MRHRDRRDDRPLGDGRLRRRGDPRRARSRAGRSATRPGSSVTSAPTGVRCADTRRGRRVDRPRNEEDGGMIGIAVIGYGYWGPNLVRNFSQTDDGAQWSPSATSRPIGAAWSEKLYPSVTTYDDVDEHARRPDRSTRWRSPRRSPPTSRWRCGRCRPASTSSSRSRSRRPWPKASELVAEAETRGLDADGRPHVHLHQRGAQDRRADPQRRPRTSCTTTTRSASTSGCSRATSACSGISACTTCRSWTSWSGAARTSVSATGMSPRRRRSRRTWPT